MSYYPGGYVLVPWFEADTYRKSEEFGSNKFLDKASMHSSNFFLGFWLMAMTHNCLSALKPAMAKEILIGTLGLIFL